MRSNIFITIGPTCSLHQQSIYSLPHFLSDNLHIFPYPSMIIMRTSQNSKLCICLPSRDCEAMYVIPAMPQIAKFMGQHGAHLGPVGPRWAPCWPHESCYQGPLTASNQQHYFLFCFPALIRYNCSTLGYGITSSGSHLWIPRRVMDLYAVIKPYPRYCFCNYAMFHMGGLVQERCNCIASAMELHLSFTDSLMCSCLSSYTLLYHVYIFTICCHKN